MKETVPPMQDMAAAGGGLWRQVGAVNSRQQRNVSIQLIEIKPCFIATTTASVRAFAFSLRKIEVT